MKHPRVIAAAARYDAKLAEIGKLQRLEPYSGSVVPILHRCLEHGEEHPCRPDSALQGRGLRCCKQSGERAQAGRKKAAAAARYDEKLTAVGRLVRLEPYAGANVPILHRCLEHGEEHPCMPANALNGQGLRCCYLASVRSQADRKKAAAAAPYDAKLAEVGRLVRLEPYAGTNVPILHRCLEHGEVHPCRPADALKGQGVQCCKLASARANADRQIAEASEVYDEKLTAVGRLVRLEPYAGANVPILHRCLEHGEEHPCRPTHALQGLGVRCCRRASIRANGDRLQAEAAARYDAKLAEVGRLARLEPYAGTNVPILHRCLEHGEVHPCRPADALKGLGVRCCRRASIRGITGRQKLDAATRYDFKLAEVGKIQRLEPYAGARVPILHRCLEHGEERLTTPTNALRGHGLWCCSLAAANLAGTLPALIWHGYENDPELLAPCQLYLYTVHDRPRLVKPGIARDHASRVAQTNSRGLYGELLAVWDLPTRTAALLVEGAILRDPAIPRPSDLDELQGLSGAGEVREIDVDALVAHAQGLVDSITDHAGPWQVWALDNVPGLYRAERIALRRQLAAVPEVP